MTRHHLHFALLAAGVVIVGAAGAAFVAEEGHGGPIDSMTDALWWAATTVTTVGYGDTYPVTAAGRGVGVALMMAGITIFGVVTANLAAFFVETDRASHTDASDDVSAEPATRADIDVLLVRIAELENLVKGLAS